MPVTEMTDVVLRVVHIACRMPSLLTGDPQRCPSQEGIPSLPSAPSIKRQNVLAVRLLFLFFFCHLIPFHPSGALSCAECRRYAFSSSSPQPVCLSSFSLKLKCDKTVPCSRYRGCYPNVSGLVYSLFTFKLQTQGLLGHLSKWQPHHWAGHSVGRLSHPSRPKLIAFLSFVLADTEKLHTKIAQMSDRIRQLEDALAILQSTQSPDPHPLLHRDLLKVKSSIELHSAVENEEGFLQSQEDAEESYIDAFGTLAIRDDGAATFYGRSAGSEVCLQTSYLTPLLITTTRV